MKHLLFLLAIIIVGCTAPITNQSPAQQTLNTTVDACSKLGAAIVSTDAAIKTGLLKGNDAKNALTGLTTAQAGCTAALTAIQAANAAASGVAK